MNIYMKECRTDQVRSLSEKYGLSLLSSTVLTRRGINEDEMVYYLEDEFLYQNSPFTVEDVYTAIERIDEALEENEKILIFGDRDTDGVTATAILYRTLKKLGAENISYMLPSGDDSYGLTEDVVNSILEQGYTLVITVDNGISALDEIRTLKRNGVDAIVTDHHLPGNMLPPALAIFDPKVEGSGYPFDGLAGCAVAAKLSWALLFSRTPLYNSSVILLHAEPGNGTVRINAVKLENLVEIDRINEEVLEGNGAIMGSRLLDFLSCNMPIIVLDADAEKNMLRLAFGGSVDISLIDFRSQLEAVMPKARNVSLYELSLRSRAARYTTNNKELETLLSLFKSVSFFSNPSLYKDFETIMQLETIGTIADLMPMRGENRLIVKKGLKLLSSKPMPSLNYLITSLNLIGRPLTAKDISYRLTPVLNAAGRMGMPEVALELLLTDDIVRAESISEELLSMNKERQNQEADSIALIRDKIKESYERLEKKMIVVEDPRLPRGLTGIISSKISQEYSVPTLVLATVEGERVSASLRCKKPYNARTLLSNFEDLLDDYGGHAFAAGFSMPFSNLDAFMERIEEYVLNFMDKSDEDESVEVDAEIPELFMNDSLFETLSLFEPFGQENPNLRFYIKKATIENVYPSQDPRYLRFSLRYGKYSWPAIWWSCNDRASFVPGASVSLIFSPDINYWRGEKKEQLVIDEMEAIES